jgi:hypothetical protein
MVLLNFTSQMPGQYLDWPQILVPATQLRGFVTVMMEALGSSETSVLTTATWRNIREDGIFHSHRSENLKSYTALTGWSL